jgi:T5SS/PEP-CTERM-associated repeat protein
MMPDYLARTLSSSRRVPAVALAVALGLGFQLAQAGVIETGDVSIIGLELQVGSSSVGSLEINGGTVVNGTYPPGGAPYMSVGAGVLAGSNGSIRVTGAGSTLTSLGTPNQQGMWIGQAGIGMLEVLNGGSVAANRLDAGTQPTGVGTLTVDGVGSTVSSASTFNIATSGKATAEITGGAVVNAELSNIGSLSGSDGKLTVSGGGSQLNLATGATPAFNIGAFLNVGFQQKGLLDILNGGKVTVDAGAGTGFRSIVAVAGGAGTVLFPASDGTVNVDGIGSELRVKQDLASVVIGGTGTGLANITNGGKLIVESNAATAFTIVGNEAGSVGTVHVTGAGSELQAGNLLLIGTNRPGPPRPGGTGIVDVATGGTVRAGSILIGAKGTLTGGGGTVTGNINNIGVIAPGDSPGILNVLGNVTLAALGTVELELGGMGFYDQLNAFDNPGTSLAEGAMSIAGLLDVSLFGGFTPMLGDHFDVFSALDISLGSPSFNLPTLAGGLGWQTQLVAVDGREALRLSVVIASVPEPSTFALLGLALAGIGFCRRLKLH